MNSFGRQAAAVLLALACSYRLPGQTIASNERLPDAPGAVMQARLSNTEEREIQGTPQSAPANAGQGTAQGTIQGPIQGATQSATQIQGIVRDAQGDPVPAAQVILSAPGKLGGRTVIASDDGSFIFNALPAGVVRLIIEAPGFQTYTSGAFAVRPGQTVDVPSITMIVASSSSVDVFATPDQVAEAQVHEQEKQRVLGVFPNFYTSYIWKAEPMPAKQKYKLAFRAIIDPVTFLIVAGVAGAEHFNGTYPGYGPGIEGYGKRYAAAYGDSLTSRVVGSAILPSILHQDPRYFYQGTGGARSRTWHALASTLVCRGDNGKTQPNYSHILGSLAAGALANTYHPESSRGLGLTFETLGITTGANAIGNLVREFVLRGLVPTVPEFANGKN